MATPAEIEAAIANAAEEGIAEAVSDGQSAKAMSIDDQIKAADRAAAVDAVSGANDQGGPKSPWTSLRPARIVTGGAGPH